MSLATKYRPNKFEDVCGQSSVIRILNRQIEIGVLPNCILFEGSSGCGKTTIARILANRINRGFGEPIEIDGASNNGVENVRNIVESANLRAVDSEYKIFIIDECHQITAAGWQAFLKCIEETPKYTIFIFCTTDPQKLPQTIINRCQTFKITKIKNTDIFNRLSYIVSNEPFTATEDALDYITRMSEGSMRQAITYLDKCKDYSDNITVEDVIAVLGDCSYDTFFDLTNARIDGDLNSIISIIDRTYSNGDDLKLFIDKYFEFILSVCKYCIFNDIQVTDIPEYYKNKLDYLVNIEQPNIFFNKYLQDILAIKQAIKGDSNIRNTVEAMLIKRGD